VARQGTAFGPRARERDRGGALASFTVNPKEAEMPKLRNGHAPGHVRETACDAFEAWLDWDGNGPEPTVEYEIHYEPHQISISRALGLVWNCTDIVPGVVFDELQDAVQGRLHSYEPVIKRRTYGACAQAILGIIKDHKLAA
jgi:hypothetical protein